MARPFRGWLSTLKRKADFDLVFAERKRFFRAGVGFYVRRYRGQEFRFGFMVPRRCGNAVERNTFRRRMRELIRLTPTLPRGADVVVTTSHPVSEYTFARLSDIWAWALLRVARLAPDKRSQPTTAPESEP